MDAYERLKKKYNTTRYRTPVSSHEQAYSIYATKDAIIDFAENSAKDIPLSQNRIRLTKKHDAMLLFCLAKRKPIKTYYKVGDIIAFVQNYNMGTKKWAEFTKYVTFGRIQKINSVTIDTDMGRINKEFVLGKVRRH